MHPFVIGGMQKHTLILCQHLLKEGMDVTLIHCVSSERNIPSDEEVNSYVRKFSSSGDFLFKSVCLKFPAAGMLPGHYIRNSRKYSKDIFDLTEDTLNEYDLVYAQGFTAWEILRRKKARPPVWINFHGLNMFQPTLSLKGFIQSLMFRRAVRWNLRNATKVISLGGMLTEVIVKQGISRSSILIHPNGISEDWISDSIREYDGQRALRFLFSGRKDKIKGYEELLNAIQKLPPDLNAEFHFAGPLEQVAVSDRIFFHGEIKDEAEMKKLYDRMDVLIMNSVSEGLPTVMLEAMARGLALLSTKVGAIPELLDEKNGQWIIPGKVAEAITAMAQCEPEIINQMKRQSLKKVHLFKWEKIIGQFISDMENQ